MKSIQPMNKRGGKEYAQDSSRTGNTMGVPSAMSNRKGNAGMAPASRTDNQMGVSTKFVDRRGGKEYATKVDTGTGYCK